MSDSSSQRAAALDGDEISLVGITNKIFRHWRILVVFPLTLGLVAGVGTVVTSRDFVASLSFMPQRADLRGPSGAAALAQQFGVDLGSDRPGESPQFYVYLLRSDVLLRRVVESEYEVPRGERDVWRGTLVEYWELDQGSRRSLPWRRAAEMLNDAIAASVSRDPGVVRVTVTMDEPVLAEAVAGNLLQLLNEFNQRVRRERASEEDRFIGARIDEAHERLTAAEGLLESFLRQNRQFDDSPDLVFEHVRLQRRVSMQEELVTSLLRSQEQARIDAVRDTPLFAVIDHPAGSAQPEEPRTIFFGTLGFLLGIVVATLVMAFSESLRRSHTAHGSDYREVEGLARDTWVDVRNPARWLRREREGAVDPNITSTPPLGHGD
jgi:uncharacterized protein involved in exopolysaccharide biosynthesis